MRSHIAVIATSMLAGLAAALTVSYPASLSTCAPANVQISDSQGQITVTCQDTTDDSLPSVRRGVFFQTSGVALPSFGPSKLTFRDRQSSYRRQLDRHCTRRCPHSDHRQRLEPWRHISQSSMVVRPLFAFLCLSLMAFAVHRSAGHFDFLCHRLGLWRPKIGQLSDRPPDQFARLHSDELRPRRQRQSFWFDAGHHERPDASASLWRRSARRFDRHGRRECGGCSDGRLSVLYELSQCHLQ